MIGVGGRRRLNPESPDGGCPTSGRVCLKWGFCLNPTPVGMRNRYRFGVVGFVVMPEHVHLLMSEPLIGNVSRAIGALKLGFTRRVLSERPHFWQHRPEVGHPDEQHFWMKRYYDFNVYSQPKIAEKLHYM